jgi:hypothetical protein
MATFVALAAQSSIIHRILTGIGTPVKRKKLTLFVVPQNGIGQASEPQAMVEMNAKNKIPKSEILGDHKAAGHCRENFDYFFATNNLSISASSNFSFPSLVSTMSAVPLGATHTK